MARSAAIQNAPDVVVIGGHLPPIGGVRTAAALREANPGVALAVVYDPDDEREERELRRAIRVGVSGVLPRGSADDAVVEVARGLVAGRPMLDAFAAEVVLSDYTQLGASSDLDVPAPTLDPREQQVLEQLAGRRHHHRGRRAARVGTRHGGQRGRERPAQSSSAGPGAARGELSPQLIDPAHDRRRRPQPHR